LITIDHAYTHFRVTLNVFHCRYRSGEPQPLECEEIRWVLPEDLHQYPFPVANVKIIEAILESPRLEKLPQSSPRPASEP
jgi:A/G-specific adenine glycosylase